MSAYPEYRQSRQSFGTNVLGTLLVTVEADDGTTGFAVTTGGEPGAFIVEKHLARFVEGARVTDIERTTSGQRRQVHGGWFLRAAMQAAYCSGSRP